MYPLPKDLVVAATIKHLPGIPQVATVTYTNHALSSALGRNLVACADATSACTQTLNVHVQQPGHCLR